jgi:hypothetical protein
MFLERSLNYPRMILELFLKDPAELPGVGESPRARVRRMGGVAVAHGRDCRTASPLAWQAEQIWSKETIASAAAHDQRAGIAQFAL